VWQTNKGKGMKRTTREMQKKKFKNGPCLSGFEGAKPKWKRTGKKSTEGRKKRMRESGSCYRLE